MREERTAVGSLDTAVEAANVESGGPASMSRASVGTSGRMVGREEADAGTAIGIGVRSSDDGSITYEQRDDGEMNDEESSDELDAAESMAAAYGNEPWLEALDPEESGPAGDASLSRSRKATLVVPEWDRVPTAREMGKEHDVIMAGPPLSGKSTLSRALGTFYQVPTITIDGTIADARKLRDPLGARVRAALHWFTAKEQVITVTFEAWMRRYYM